MEAHKYRHANEDGKGAGCELVEPGLAGTPPAAEALSVGEDSEAESEAKNLRVSADDEEEEAKVTVI